MIRTAVGLLALLILLLSLRASDKAATQTPAQQYEAIMAEYRKAQADFTTTLTDARTPQDQKKISEEKWLAKKDEIKSRLLKLAENNPKAPISADALIAVVRMSPWTDNTPDSPAVTALTLLGRDHAGSDKLLPFIERLLPYALDDASPKFLRGVVEKSPSREIRGKACLALAQQAEYRLRKAQECKDYPDRAKRSESVYGKKIVAKLRNADLDKLRREAVASYERVGKDYGDLSAEQGGTIKELAEIKLEVLRNPIVVGKPAPEIAGEDIDGKRFKLSDYRGKVVLLDFWGNW